MILSWLIITRNKTSKRIPITIIINLFNRRKKKKKHTKNTHTQTMHGCLKIMCSVYLHNSFTFSHFVVLSNMVYTVCTLWPIEFRVPSTKIYRAKKGFQIKQTYKQRRFYDNCSISLITDFWVPTLHSIFHSNHFRITTIFGGADCFLFVRNSTNFRNGVTILCFKFKIINIIRIGNFMTIFKQQSHSLHSFLVSAYHSSFDESFESSKQGVNVTSYTYIFYMSVLLWIHANSLETAKNSKKKNWQHEEKKNAKKKKTNKRQSHKKI